MSFGLLLGPRTFTKCVESDLALLRQILVHILAYLDDWALVVSSEERAAVQLSQTLRDIQALGFSRNLQKTSVIPNQEFSLLGLEICSLSGQARLLEHRVVAFRRCLSQFQLGCRLRFPHSFTANRHDGVNDRNGTTRAVKDASVSTLDAISPALCTMSPPNGAAVRGLWTAVHCMLHINYLELLPIFLALKHFYPVLIRTDNMNR